MTKLEHLTSLHNAGVLAARGKLLPCPKCKSKPKINYAPGASFTTCPREHCPCISAAPDRELDLLVERINKKIES